MRQRRSPFLEVVFHAEDWLLIDSALARYELYLNQEFTDFDGVWTLSDFRKAHSNVQRIRDTLRPFIERECE